MLNPESTVNPNMADEVIVEPVIVDAADAASQLGAIIPTAKGRKWAYAGYALVALIAGNTAVGFAAANVNQPVWLVVTSAIVANLAAPFSALAIANARS